MRKGLVVPSLLRAFAYLVASALPGLAQDNAADRAEMDVAAGRVLFQNSPLALGIVELRPTASPPAPPGPVPPGRRRREVRVVLPSPYSP